MRISELSIRRPVFATVMSLAIVLFGVISFTRLPVREYPDIDPPVVTIDTVYPGASAYVVESQITQLVEERIAGVEGIRFIESSSEDGRSRVTIEFSTGRDIDAAANDLRDRVSRIVDDLPAALLRDDVPDAEAIMVGFNREIRRMQVDGTYNDVLGLEWIRVDVDGDGRLDYVHGKGAVGPEKPRRRLPRAISPRPRGCFRRPDWTSHRSTASLRRCRRR